MGVLEEGPSEGMCRLAHADVELDVEVFALVLSSSASLARVMEYQRWDLVVRRAPRAHLQAKQWPRDTTSHLLISSFLFRCAVVLASIFPTRVRKKPHQGAFDVR